MGGGTGGAAPCVDASIPGPIDAGCSIDCGTVPCPVRCAAPRLLIGMAFDQQITAIAASANALYVGTRPVVGSGTIYSMPIAGGAPTVLTAGVQVRELSLDGDTLYYVSGAGGLSGVALRAIRTAGGAPIELYQALEITDVTPDPSGVYFTAQYSGRPSEIVHVDRDGTNARRVVSNNNIAGFALDDENIYVTGSTTNGGFLFRTPLRSGTGTTLVSSMDPITRPVVDGSDIVFVQGISTPDTCRSAVMMIPKSGAAQGATRLSPGTSGVDVMGVVRDDTHLYWSSSGLHGAVLRARKGQIPEIIAAEQQSASKPVLGPKDVYWIARAGSNYEVRTVPK